MILESDILFDYYGSSEYVTVPDGVKRIDADVFNHSTSVKKIRIPKSVEGLNINRLSRKHPTTIFEIEGYEN